MLYESVSGGKCRCIDGYYYVENVGIGAYTCNECAVGFYVNDNEECVRCGESLPSGQFAENCAGDNQGTPSACTTCDEQVIHQGSVYDQRAKTACRYDSDVVCEICNVCEADEYESEACGGNDPYARQCLPCDTLCPAGSYVNSNNCGGGIAGSCTACASCPFGQYRQGCGGMDAGECVARPVCDGTGGNGTGEWLYLASGGNSVVERGVCMDCADCRAEAGDSDAAVYLDGCGGTQPGECKACACANETGYYSLGCSGTDAGVCEECGECVYDGHFLDGCGGLSAGHCESCADACVARGECTSTSTAFSCDGDSFDVIECDVMGQADCPSVDTPDLSSTLNRQYLHGCGNGHRGECETCAYTSCGVDMYLSGCRHGNAGECRLCDEKPDNGVDRWVPCNDCVVGAELYGSPAVCKCSPGNVAVMPFIVETGGATLLEGGSCEACGGGAFSTAFGRTTCTDCPAGTYTLTTTSTACTQCPFSVPGAGGPEAVIHGNVVWGAPGLGVTSCSWSCAPGWITRVDNLLGCMECDPSEYCHAGEYLADCVREEATGLPDCQHCAQWNDLHGHAIARLVDAPTPTVGDMNCYFDCTGDGVDEHGTILDVGLGGTAVATAGGVDRATTFGYGPGFVCGWVCSAGYIRVVGYAGDEDGLVGGTCVACNNAMCDVGHWYDYGVNAGGVNLSSSAAFMDCPLDGGVVVSVANIGEYGSESAVFAREWDHGVQAMTHCKPCSEKGITLPANAHWDPAGGCDFICDNADSNPADVDAWFDYSMCEWRCSEGNILGAVGKQYENFCRECDVSVHCEISEYLESCSPNRAVCMPCANVLGALTVGQRWGRVGGVVEGSSSCQIECMPRYIAQNGDPQNGCILCEHECADDFFLNAFGNACDSDSCVPCRSCVSGEYEALACSNGNNRECVSCTVCGVREYERADCTTTMDRDCVVCRDCDAGSYWSGGCNATTLDRQCTPCPANSWCANGVETKCAIGASSPIVSSLVSDCECDVDGEYVDGDACTLRICPANQYRNGNQCETCPAQSTSNVSSVGVLSCVCPAGYYRLSNSNTGKFDCMLCKTRCSAPGELGLVAAQCHGDENEDAECVCNEAIPNGVISNSNPSQCTVACVGDDIDGPSGGLDVLDIAPISRVYSQGWIGGTIYGWSLRGSQTTGSRCANLALGSVSSMVFMGDYLGNGDQLLLYTVSNKHAVYEFRFTERNGITTFCYELFGSGDTPNKGCATGVCDVTGKSGGTLNGLMLRFPRAVEYDGAQSIFISDSGNQRILRVEYKRYPDVWQARTIVSSDDEVFPTMLAYASDDSRLYFYASDEHSIYSVSGATGGDVRHLVGTGDDEVSETQTAASFSDVTMMNYCMAGVICVLDSGHVRIVRIDSGKVRTLSIENDGSAASVAGFLGGAVVVYGFPATVGSGVDMHFYDSDQMYGGVLLRVEDLLDIQMMTLGGIGALYGDYLFVLDSNGVVVRYEVGKCGHGEVMNELVGERRGCVGLPCVREGGCGLHERFEDGVGCKCNAGYYRQSNGFCAICPAGSWCGGYATSEQTTSCELSLQGGVSSAGATSSGMCYCPVGEFKTFNTQSGGATHVCENCPVGFWCPGGLVNNGAAVPCGGGKLSLVGAEVASECFCRVNFTENANGTCIDCSGLSSVCVDNGGGSGGTVDRIAMSMILHMPSVGVFIDGLATVLSTKVDRLNRRLLSAEVAVDCPSQDLLDGTSVAEQFSVTGNVWIVYCEAWFLDDGGYGDSSNRLQQSIVNLDSEDNVLEVQVVKSVSVPFSSGVTVVSCGVGEMRYANPDGADDCWCGYGYYRASEGALACTMCAANTYKNVISDVLACVACPYASVSDEGEERCVCTNVGERMRADGSRCYNVASGEDVEEPTILGLPVPLFYVVVGGVVVVLFLCWFCLRSDDLDRHTLLANSDDDEDA